MHQLREDLSTYSSMPISYAVGDRNLLLTKGPHSRAELLEALNSKEITRESAVTSVSRHVLSRQLQLTALAMGNMAEEDARQMMGDFMVHLQPSDADNVTMADADAEVQRVSPIVKINGPIEVRKLNPVHGDRNDVRTQRCRV